MQYPVTYNDPELTRRNLGALQRTLGARKRCVEPADPRRRKTSRFIRR